MDSDNRWHGYPMTTFSFEGRQASLVYPDTALPHRPWAIYTEYFGAFPGVALELLRRGWHLARLENSGRFASPWDQDVRHRFVLHLHQHHWLNRRCVPIGLSCGGLHALAYAQHYPEDVAAMYLDAPVVSLFSYPFAYALRRQDDAVVQECLAALRITREALLSWPQPLYRLHEPALNQIPLALVYGDADTTVPYEENGLLLENVYRRYDAPLAVFAKAGCDHHPHGLDDPAPIADLLEEWMVNSRDGR